jgi:hypothetical protein
MLGEEKHLRERERERDFLSVGAGGCVGSRCRGCFLYNNESKHEAWERNYRERGGVG